MTAYSQIGNLNNASPDTVYSPTFTPSFTDTTISFPLVQAKPLYFYLTERNYLKKNVVYLQELYTNSQKVIENQSSLIVNKSKQTILLEENYKLSQEQNNILKKKLRTKNTMLVGTSGGLIISILLLLLSK